MSCPSSGAAYPARARCSAWAVAETSQRPGWPLAHGTAIAALRPRKLPGEQCNRSETPAGHAKRRGSASHPRAGLAGTAMRSGPNHRRRGAAAGCRRRVLMLPAAAASEDIVGGLGLGADDYLPKPLDFPVLVARIGALARRAHPAVPPVLRKLCLHRWVTRRGFT